jgi:hypothetical protein
LQIKPLRVKQYNTIQHYKTYIHEQHKEMSYIHSKSYTLTNVNLIFAILTIALYSQQHWAKILDQELI